MSGADAFWNPSTESVQVICTSSTRPASPAEGQQIYETDTDLSYRWNGSAWIQVQALAAAQTWSPTVTQGGALTMIVQMGMYSIVGNMVHISFLATPGATGTASNLITIGGIPSAIQTTLYGTFYGNQVAIGAATALDAGTTWYAGSLVLTSASTMSIQVNQNAAWLGQQPTWTLASGDRLMGTASWYLR